MLNAVSEFVSFVWNGSIHAKKYDISFFVKKVQRIKQSLAV